MPLSDAKEPFDLVLMGANSNCYRLCITYFVIAG